MKQPRPATIGYWKSNTRSGDERNTNHDPARCRIARRPRTQRQRDEKYKKMERMNMNEDEMIVNKIRKKLYTWIRFHGGRKPEWLIIDAETLKKIKPYRDKKGVPAYAPMEIHEIPRFDGYKIAIVDIVGKVIAEWVANSDHLAGESCPEEEHF